MAHSIGKFEESLIKWIFTKVSPQCRKTAGPGLEQGALFTSRPERIEGGGHSSHQRDRAVWSGARSGDL